MPVIVGVELGSTALAAGAVIATAGATLSIVYVRTWVVVLPCSSDCVARPVYVPSARVPPVTLQSTRFACR